MTDGLLFAQQVFSDQVTSEEFSQTAFYMLATAAVVLAIGGMCLVDLGLVQRKNVLDTCMQKLIGSLIGGFSFAIVGYAVWNWQYNTAFEVPNSLGQSISDWWLGGTNLVTFSQNLDPAVVPHADVLQVFLPFNMAFAAVVCSFIHSIGIERMKASAFYIICGVVGGVIFPVVLYLMWGSVSPLTARGVHDFVGVFPLYIFVGFFGLLLAWRLGPRLGAFSRHAETAGPAPYNQGLTAVGVGLLLFAISIFAMGCGFFIPGEGYYGITWTTSGLGITISNVVMAFCAGALGGAVVGYLTRNLIIAMTGPLAGWIAIASGADILKPWEVAIISGVAPIVALIGYTLLLRLRVDEKKIVPLGLFVMQRAADDLHDWQREIGDVPLSVSVNLSSRQLIRRDLVNDVSSVIARASIKPRCFRLELTESLVMDNPEQTTHVLNRLASLGIGLSLDDFGTGYSSLSYLTRFPFDTIKIDKSFVDDQSPRRGVLLKSMISMAHELGLSVVAEGVADESDALQLRQMGCEYVQSFAFGPPIPAEATLRLLKEQYPLTA